jgi:L,D-transpeptidase catalytic domain
MNEIWYSKQWDNAPMPHSIFFMRDGHAIHGSNEVKNLGKPVSHGCVRISPENAAYVSSPSKKTVIFWLVLSMWMRTAAVPAPPDFDSRLGIEIGANQIAPFLGVEPSGARPPRKSFRFCTALR